MARAREGRPARRSVSLQAPVSFCRLAELPCRSLARLLVRTNFTEPSPPTPPARSRGALLADFLSPPPPPPPLPSPSSSADPTLGCSPLAFLSESLAAGAHAYAGFNLLLFSVFPLPAGEDLSSAGEATSSPPTTDTAGRPVSFPNARLPSAPVEIGYLSNRSPTPSAVDPGPSASCQPAIPSPVEDVSSRIAGLSNSLLGEPWPKVSSSRQGLEGLLAEEAGVGWEADDWIERLEHLMRSVPSLSLSRAPACIPFKNPDKFLLLAPPANQSRRSTARPSAVQPLSRLSVSPPPRRPLPHSRQIKAQPSPTPENGTRPG